jgi:hypothetical protein
MLSLEFKANARLEALTAQASSIGTSSNLVERVLEPDAESECGEATGYTSKVNSGYHQREIDELSDASPILIS